MLEYDKIPQDIKDKLPPIALDFLKDSNSFKYLTILNGDAAGDEGAKVIAEVLKTNRTVTKLKYFSNSMGDEGATAFGEMLENNKTITECFIFSTKTGTVGGQKLAEGIKNSNIKKLYLSCKNIGNDGIAAIGSALQDHKTISSMTFHNQDFTDYQLAVIAESLKNNKKVIEFSIVGTNAKVTEDGIRHIYHMLDSNPRIIKGDLYININNFSFTHKESEWRESYKEKLDYNLSKLNKLAEFINNNRESFVNKFDITCNPKHPSALKFYQQSDKDLLSEKLKSINPSIEPESLFRKIDSYIKHNWPSLSGICKNLQSENNSDSKGLYNINENLISVIGGHLDLDDIIN